MTVNPSNTHLTAMMNGHYHADRHSYFTTLDRALKLAIIVLGTSILAKAHGLFHVGEDVIELALVIVASFHLVVDFAGRAKDHELWRKQYFELLGEPDDAKVVAALVRLGAEEPPTKRAALALAYNRALDASEFDATIRAAQRRRVTWLNVVLRHIFTFNRSDFAPNGYN